MRKLTVILLVGAVCVLGVIPASAEVREPVPTQYVSVQEYEKATGKKIEKFSEAPALRVKVAAGELPPVEERLPEEPLVLIPVEEIGQYGGTWHRGWTGLADKWGPSKIMAETLIRLSRNGTEILPNLAIDWEVSEDAKTFTFYLRQGVKWSDGHPFTADDILFYFEDVLLNKELSPSLPSWFVVGGEPGKIEKLDDYTIKFNFKEPYGLFLTTFALESREVSVPKHYLKQFHPRYTLADELEKMTKEAGYERWDQLYYSKAGTGWWDENLDHPTLWAWKLVVPGTATRMVHEPNPYYWKVDPEGNQLPYIDRVTHDMVENSDMINFKAATGEIDMQMRHILFSNYTLFMENREKGDFRVLKWRNAFGADPMIMPNQTCKDPILRELFQNARFRQALSLAINRDAINEYCYLGTAEPRQASIVSGAPYYSEKWEKAYAEYDPKGANALLDEIGLTERDKEGYRLRSDGKTLSVTIEIASGVMGPWVDACELIRRNWEDVGIKTRVKTEERSLFHTRQRGNDQEIAVWYMDRQAPWVADPFHIIFGGEGWGLQYYHWYQSGGEAGQEPTGDVAKLYELWDKITVCANEAERDLLVEKVIELHAKNIWMIGTVGETICPVVVKNNFRNVPEELIRDECLRSPTNADPEQFFVKQ